MTETVHPPGEGRYRPAKLADEVVSLLQRSPVRRPVWQDGALAARMEQNRLAAARAAGPEVGKIFDATIDGSGGPVSLRCYTPTEEPIAAMVYFHGGGWVMGGIEDTDAHARRVVTATQTVIVSVGYRLAPENPFPAAIEDALSAWQWALENHGTLGGEALPIGIGGDSAGGNVAAGAAIAIRDLGLVPPSFQVLGYPALSAEMDTLSYREQAEGPLLSAADMRWFWEQYAPEAWMKADPRAAPLCATDLSGLPPALIMTGQCDPLRDEGQAYARRLNASGVPARYRCYPGMVHGFYKLADLLSAGQDALTEAAKFIAEQAAVNQRAQVAALA